MQRCSIHFSSEKINWKLTITLCLNKLFPSNCPHTKICFVVIIASLQYNFEKYIHWTYLILLSQSIKLKWKICVGWTYTTSKKLYAHVPEKKRLINSNVDAQESKQGWISQCRRKKKHHSKRRQIYIVIRFKMLWWVMSTEIVLQRFYFSTQYTWHFTELKGLLV